MTPIEGGVTAPKGYRASGVAAGIKSGSTKKDCALIVSETPATVAGVFTTNVMKSPPVLRNVEVCERGTARAVFMNSGNANAATGEVGERDVTQTAEWVAAVCGCNPAEVCLCSTGVIGVPLPMDRIQRGVNASAKALSAGGSLDAAEAIMTTDTVPKERAKAVTLSKGAVRIGGIAKGSGMIAPNMATMIAVITTDASIEPATLRPPLKKAVARSFNRIGIDNDMSTSDTVLVLANASAELPPLTEGSDDLATFTEALTTLCEELAKDLVRDGEGATKFVEIAVSGTESDSDAQSIARAIGLSQLSKAAFFGEDPNWGRFACAAGYAGVEFNPAHISVALDDLTIMHKGIAADYTEEDAASVMKQPEFAVHVSVGDGPGRALFWTSDLSHGYVSINTDYRT